MMSNEAMNAIPQIFVDGINNGIIEGLKIAWPIFVLCAIALIAKIILKK